MPTALPPDKLYPLDLDRAFKKLDTIKARHHLVDRRRAVAAASRFRRSPVRQLLERPPDRARSRPASMSRRLWDQNITAADVLVVPKGAKNKEAAMKFIALATSAEGQADMAAAPAMRRSISTCQALMDAELRKTLPDKQSASQVNADMDYWAENRDEIGERWYAWQAK